MEREITMKAILGVVLLACVALGGCGTGLLPAAYDCARPEGAWRCGGSQPAMVYPYPVPLNQYGDVPGLNPFGDALKGTIDYATRPPALPTPPVTCIPMNAAGGGFICQ